jgi:nicotinic acid mononucleotide adenylyltransferase
MLREIGRIVPLRSYEESYLSIRTTQVLAQIESGDPSWEALVPPAVAQIIKSKNLFQKQHAHEAISS